MIDEEKILKNQWIIIALIVAVLVLNVVFILIDRLFPAGEFKGSSMSVAECSISGLKVTGFGASDDSALSNLLAKQENYAHLYCNGKFRGDPDEVAIPNIGCPACKPRCSPTVTDITNASFGKTEGGVEAYKTVLIKCV
jgi:hypothetical protein